MNCGRDITIKILNLKSFVRADRNKRAFKHYNHNYIKILESDWSSACLISAAIVQLNTSCACNCTVVHVMPEYLDSTRHQARASCTFEGLSFRHVA